ncbi:MAG: ATP-grasp domain-containing protein [Geminicoccaceae bacterium]
MTPERTILFSSAGRRVELIQCFRDSAAALGIEARVIALDLEPAMSAACQVADLALPVPRCAHPEFAEVLLGICAEHGVDLLVPTIDPELAVLSRHAERFGALGTRIAVSEPAVVEMARDKLRTAQFLAHNGIPAPRSAPLAEVVAAPQDWTFPLLVKPRSGSSSIGVRVVPSPEELAALAPGADPMVQQLLRGDEYTVNLFFDRTGCLRCAIPHLRCAVRAGEVAKGLTRRHAELERIAAMLGAALDGARGALCFQAIVDDGGAAAVFEINARFGGGYPLAHRAGARFAQWLLEEITGRPLSAHNDWQDGILMLRYDQAVFRDGSRDR